MIINCNRSWSVAGRVTSLGLSVPCGCGGQGASFGLQAPSLCKPERRDRETRDAQETRESARDESDREIERER